MGSERCSRIFPLQTMCAATIVRHDVPTHPMRTSPLGDRVTALQERFKSAEDRLEYSGDMVLIMASASGDVWDDPDCIKWFAAGDHIEHVRLAMSMHSKGDSVVDLVTGIAFCLEGALTGENFTCLRHACRLILKHNLDVMVMVEMLYESDNFAHLKAVPLSVMSMHLGWKSRCQSSIRNSAVFNRDLCTVQTLLHGSRWFVLRGVHSLVHRAIETDNWNVIQWMSFLEIRLDMVYVALCMKMGKYHLLGEDLRYPLQTIPYYLAVWIWKECSATTLQWALINLDSMKKSWMKFDMRYATHIKLDLLEEQGVRFSEIFTTNAMMVCPVSVVEKILDMSRSWNPVECMRAVQEYAGLACSDREDATIIARDKQRILTEKARKMGRRGCMTEHTRIRHRRLSRNRQQTDPSP